MRNFILGLLAAGVLAGCLIFDMARNEGNATAISFIPMGIAAVLVVTAVGRAYYNGYKERQADKARTARR